MIDKRAERDVAEALDRGMTARELLVAEFQPLVGRNVLVLRMQGGNLHRLEVEAPGKIVHVGIGGHYDFLRSGNDAWVAVSIDYPMKIRGVVRTTSKCFEVYAEAPDFVTLFSRLRDKFPTMFPINRGFVLCDPEVNPEEFTSMVFLDER